MQKPRKFEGGFLVVATHNQGKLRELRDYLDPLGVKIKSANDLDLPEPEETEKTFIGNAVLKARAAALHSGQICLADDSGLSVDALNGDPGIYSARWAEDGNGARNFATAMKKVNDMLGANPDRKAHFTCAIALCWPDGHCETVEGYAKGDLVWPPRGPDGFGYDPIFRPAGHDLTFGEMTSLEKAALSHRKDAIEQIIEKCFQ